MLRVIARWRPDFSNRWQRVEEIMRAFMDPTTDYGFKKLFGDETNKDLTMSSSTQK